MEYEIMKRLLDEQRIILDSIPAWIFYKDRENRFVWVNKFHSDMMGIPREELIGKSMLDLYPKEQAAAFWRDDKEVLDTGNPKLGIVESVDTKNGRRWVSTDKMPYRDDLGNIIGVIGFAIDITDRRKAEEDLKESETKFKTLIEDARDGIVVADAETKRFLLSNKSFCDMLGYERDSVNNLCTEDIHTKEALPFVLDQFNKLVAGKIKVSRDIPVKRKDGTIFYVDIVASPITLGGRRCMMGNFRDITERKTLEKELRDKIWALETFNKVAVDRELKMEELKNKIKTLEAKLQGKEAP